MRQVLFYSSLTKVGDSFEFNKTRHSDSFNLIDFKESFYRLTNSKLSVEIDLFPDNHTELIQKYGSLPRYYTFKNIKGVIGHIAIWVLTN